MFKIHYLRLPILKCMSVLVERELVARVTLTVSLLQLKARSQRDPDCKVSRGFYVNIPIATIEMMTLHFCEAIPSLRFDSFHS
jgi:hypothetical protein